MGRFEFISSYRPGGLAVRLEALRGLLLDRLVFNLALLLGVAQAAIVHWVWAVSSGALIGPGWMFVGTVAAVAANAFGVPHLRRNARRQRADWRGWLARSYMMLGVASLLIALAVWLGWLLWLPVAVVSAVFSLGVDFAAFRLLSGCLVGATALAVLWGFTFGQARVTHTRLGVRLPGLHRELSGLRIVQISDLHIGNRLEGVRLDGLLDRVNRTDPDVVVLTGDLFDFDPSHVPDGVRRLAALRARYGVYAILGNHDAYVGADLVADAFARFAPNLRLLRDEVVRLPLPHALYLAGVEDPGVNWSRRRVELDGLNAVAAARPDDGPTVLLVHRPEAFEQAERLGFPLVLAGHTHGGQIAAPVGGGQLNLARVMSPLTRGVYRRGDTTLYVNRGLGVAGPAIRIGCTREITTIELRATKQTQSR